VGYGADINKGNNNNITPLSVACYNEHIEVVKYLVEHGTDINKEDRFDNTPLSIACEKEDEDIILYLIKRGSYMNKRLINRLNSKIIKLLQNFENEKRKKV